MLVQVGVVQQVGVVANQVHKLHYNLSNKLNDMHRSSCKWSQAHTSCEIPLHNILEISNYSHVTLFIYAQRIYNEK